MSLRENTAWPRSFLMDRVLPIDDARFVAGRHLEAQGTLSTCLVWGLGLTVLSGPSALLSPAVILSLLGASISMASLHLATMGMIFTPGSDVGENTGDITKIAIVAAMAPTAALMALGHTDWLPAITYAGVPLILAAAGLASSLTLYRRHWRHFLDLAAVERAEREAFVVGVS